MKKILLLILMVTLVHRPAMAISLGYAQEDGGRAGSFLDYAASVRSIGMGRAYTGLADDASAVYWNPAGLYQIDRKDAVALYSALPRDTGIGVVNYAQPTPSIGTFGVGFVNLQSNNFKKTNEFGDRIGTFGYSESALLVSHGLSLSRSFALGSTIKAVRKEVDTYSSTGFGADFGIMSHIYPGTQVGLMFRNMIAPRLQLNQKGEDYERQVRLGIMLAPHPQWTVSFDVDKTQKRTLKFLLGTEWNVNENLALRWGLNENEITTGLGLYYGDWEIGYALGYHDATAAEDDLGVTHRLGFHLRFGETISTLKQEFSWKKRGEILLAQLATHMESTNPVSPEELKRLTYETQDVTRHQGFGSATNAYIAKGSLYYLQGHYDQSLVAFQKAANARGTTQQLASTIEKVRQKLTDYRKEQIKAYKATLTYDLNSAQ